MTLGPFQILRDVPRYRRLWLATSISELGSMVSRIAFVLLVHERATAVGASSERWVALVMAVETLPLVLCGPIAGALVDRWDRRRLLVVANLIQMLFLAAVPFAVRLEAMWPLFALASVISGVGTVFPPARQSAIPDLVPPGGTARANAVSSTTTSACIVLAPLITALLIGFGGKDLCFWTDAASFALCAASLSTLALPRKAESSRTVSSILSETRAGLAFVARDRVLLYMHVTYFMAWVFVGVWMPIVPAFLQRFVGVDPDVWMPRTWFAFGVGGLVGGFLGERLGRRFGMGRVVVLILFLEPITLVAYGFATNPLAVIALSAWWGLLAFAFFVQESTVLHEDVPASLHGRVFGLQLPLQGLGMLIATLVVIAAGGAVGPEYLLIASGIAYLGTTLIATLVLRGGSELWKRAPRMPAPDERLTGGT